MVGGSIPPIPAIFPSYRSVQLKSYLTVIRDNFRRRFVDKHFDWIVREYERQIRGLLPVIEMEDWRKVADAAGFPLTDAGIKSRLALVVDTTIPFDGDGV